MTAQCCCSARLKRFLLALCLSKAGVGDVGVGGLFEVWRSIGQGWADELEEVTETVGEEARYMPLVKWTMGQDVVHLCC